MKFYLKSKIIVLDALMVMFVAACAPSILSSYNVDPEADFNRYATFGWDSPLNKAADKSYNPLVNNSLVNKQLKEAIKDEMELRGYKLTEGKPDLLINFHTMVESKSEVSTIPNNYYFWWRNDIETINYKEGTLIIDVIDAEKDQLVWQGFTSNKLNSKELAASLKGAVETIFQKYTHRAGQGQAITKNK